MKRQIYFDERIKQAMGRTIGAKGKEKPDDRERGRLFCELVSARWCADTGRAVCAAEIARRLSEFVSVSGRQYIAWGKGSTGLTLEKFFPAARAAIENGWLSSEDLPVLGLGFQAGLARDTPSAIAEMRKQRQAEVAEFNKTRRSLVASLKDFETAWRGLKHSVPKDLDYIHLAALNAEEDAGRLSASQRRELQAFNEYLAPPRPDLLADICVLPMELGRLRALPDPSQGAARPRQASMHDITPDITLVGPVPYPVALDAVLGENQEVVWDATIGEYVIRTRGAFDNLIKLSLDRSFKVLRSSLEAVTKLAHSRRELM